MKHWSISGLAAEFRLDRRTVAKYLDLGDVKPAPERGLKGHQLFPLRPAVNALVDAGYLGTDRADDWSHRSGRESGARELAEAVLDALAKRLERPALRVVREVVAEELHRLIGVIYEREDAEAFHGAQLSDAELEAALRSLIEEGFLEDNPA